MLRARHSPLFTVIFSRYVRRLIRGHFRELRVHGSLPDTRAPLLVACQHVSWWDPIVLFHLSRARPNGVHYTMMDEQNLRRLSFFGKLGAFGLDPSQATGALRYALRKLRDPHARVWIFPQGALAPADARPLVCERGADWLAMRARVPVVPVALRYEFGDGRLPTAYVWFGEPLMVDEEGVIESRLNATADRLADAIHRGNDALFARVLGGRRTLSDRYSRAPVVRRTDPDRDWVSSSIHRRGRTR